VVYSSFGGSLFLIAAGAILRFAVNTDLDWIELHTTGDILMGTGAPQSSMSQWRPPSTTTLPGTISSSDAYLCSRLAPLRVEVTTSYLKATGRQLTLVRVEEADAAARRAISQPTSS
jgi:hypothetical protein